MTSKTLLSFLIGLAVISLLVMVLFPKMIDFLGSYILLLTLLAIVFYSWETSQLRTLSMRQIELSLKPHLEIVFQRAHFRLYNIGNGPAVHVEIEDVKVVPPGKQPKILRFTCPPVIKKDEYLPIDIEIRTHDGEDREVEVPSGFFTPPLAKETISINVHYENLTGTKYGHKLIIGKGMAIDTETRRPRLANNTGGLSGPAIRPVAVRMVWQVAQCVDVPLIGLGGITSAQDALEFIIAGATAVAIGTGLFLDPTVPLRVIAGIREYLVSHDLRSVGDVRGTLRTA